LHAEGWIKTGRAQIVAVASPSQSTQKNFQNQFGCTTYSNASEMIEKEELDVLSLTLPNKFHHE
jgi:predicted dehydrogenase